MSHVPHIVIMTVDTIVLIVLTVNTGWCIISYESTHLPLIESKGQRIKQRYTTKSLLFRKWVGFYDMDARNAALEQLFNVENSAHLEREREDGGIARGLCRCLSFATCAHADNKIYQVFA